jgi:hypothetical protein
MSDRSPLPADRKTHKHGNDMVIRSVIAEYDRNMVAPR